MLAGPGATPSTSAILRPSGASASASDAPTSPPRRCKVVRGLAADWFIPASTAHHALDFRRRARQAVGEQREPVRRSPPRRPRCTHPVCSTSARGTPGVPAGM